ncbi:uncharacterized protein LOC143225747 isoform X2 [Tachypleus tridentatus]|uniref:uncharacterized protein LOC143225747 isoform X2 n=1 Tax=Tachypleus tridentatus TaxID=6853 RepID=UPI003FD0D54D
MMGNFLPKALFLRKENDLSSSVVSVLDNIVSQAEIDKDYEVYKFANYQKGGTLIEAYNRGGSKDVERISRETLEPYMYDNGEGTVVSELEYLHWRHRKRDEVAIPVDSLISCASRLANVNPEERRICWKLEFRGMLGESLLHVLIMCNTPIHARIARILLKIYPHLAWDIIEGEEYFGASALHLSIAYNMWELVLLSVESGANISQRATGRFFMPYDQQRPSPKRQTNFEGLCYMGEYPLAWAACCEDETVYNMLLRRGADPNLQDTLGNMILHVVVIRDKLEFWRYSNITCSGYPLNALDSILPSGKTNWNSALMIILNGKTNEHLDMLDGGVIQRLLEEKWKTFARKEFLKRLVLMFLHLIALSIAVSLRPSSDGNLLGPSDLRSICRYSAELVTCLGCIGFVIFQQGEEIMSQGLLGFLINLSSNPAKAIFLFANILILCCLPCRLLGYRHTEDVLLTFAIPGSWFFLIFFAGAVKLTGPFVTMIYNMLVGDIVRFSIIYFIYLLGFTQAFFFLFKNQSGDSKRFTTYSQTWMALFHMTLGYYEYSEFSETFYSALTWFVFAIFMVIMPILMLNMLIAMMGNTYCEVITQSEREFVKQWAKIVVALERGVSQKKAKEYMQSYSIRLASPSGDDDPEKEQRAVMVIKSKSKSKAKQRKGALSNWKRLGKIVIQEMRQCGGTAEQFRQKYWTNHHFSTSACKPFPVDGSDDSDSERGAAIDSGNGLGVALNQLAFAHDLDFSKSSVTPQSASPSDKESATPTGGKTFGDLFQQLAWAHDLEVGRPQTPTGCHRDSERSQSRPTSPSPEQNTNPSNTILQDTETSAISKINTEASFPTQQSEQFSDPNQSDEAHSKDKHGNTTTVNIVQGIDNPAFVCDAGACAQPLELEQAFNLELPYKNLMPKIVIQQESDLDNTQSQTELDNQDKKKSIKRKRRKKHKKMCHRGRVGAEVETCSQKFSKSRCHKKTKSANNSSTHSRYRKHVKFSDRNEHAHQMNNYSESSETSSSCDNSRLRTKSALASRTRHENSHSERQSQPVYELTRWSTKNVVAMTSILAWNDDSEL